jgi:hypothetical protein
MLVDTWRFTVSDIVRSIRFFTLEIVQPSPQPLERGGVPS